MAWDFSTDPDFQEHLDWARRLVEEEIWPLETLGLDRDTLDRALAPLKLAVKERGLWAAHLPPELGGQGYGQVKLGLLNEIVGTSPLAPLAFGNQPPDSGNSEILAVSGTHEQRRRWLGPLLAGDVRSAFAMTEPGAGADPTKLSCRARRAGDGWVLDGRKWFVSSAAVADFVIVMAVSDPDAEPHRRASMLIVPAGTPGMSRRALGSLEDPAGTSPLGGQAELTFEGCRVPADALLGEVGEGFAIAQRRLGPGRIHHCMRWLGMAQRALDMLCERATYREVRGGLLADKQTVQSWIADSAAEIRAARLMTLHAAWVMDTQGVKAARREIALIKFLGARALHDVVDRALQAHGALGFSGDLPLESMYRQARAARLYDGPDEVHRESVARQILRGYEPPPDGVPSEHVPTRRAAARDRWGDLE